MYYQSAYKGKRKKRSGSSIIETVAGLFILVPICLFFIDIAAAVLAQMWNDQLAKTAARYAAKASDQAHSDMFASKAVSDCFTGAGSTYVVPPGGFGNPISALVLPTTYNIANPNNPGGTVTVTTNVVCNFPVPLANWKQITFTANATEPIVAMLPAY